MLTRVADGVLVHTSGFLQSNTTVVRGGGGVLLIDPGIEDRELACLADDLSGAGHAVVAGFSTHPDWDHLLWHDRLGTPPRLGTAGCAEAVRKEMADPGIKDRVTEHLAGTEIAGLVSLAGYGRITGLPAGTTRLPWDGPQLRIIEHRGHAPGHAALFAEDSGVLVAGDMLSDVLVPMLDLEGAADPVGDYLAGLRLLEEVADRAGVLVPGHGSVGGAGETRVRIERDRAYVLALGEGREPEDPRIGAAAAPGWEWVTGIHEWQARQLAGRG